MAALHLFCIPPRAAAERAREAGAAPVPAAQAASWFFLAAAAVSLLLAVTNVITFDVASVPLLWVLPLSVYLLTFVLTFKRRPWFPDAVRRLFPWIVVAGILVQLLSRLRLGLPGGVAIAIHVLVLFVACVNGHGRLVASRPADARHLTTFYLLLAAGGVAGGLLVSWVAPLVSASLIEYPLALAAVAGALAFSGRGAGAGGGRGWAGATAGVLTAAVALTVVPWAAGLRLGTDGPWGGAVFVLVAVPVVLVLRAAARRPARLALVTVTVAVAMNWTEDLACGASAVKRHRNYYGMYRVFDRDNLRYLQHGTTQHGRQYLSGPRRETPLAYFHPSTPAAGVLTSPRFAFRRIGMVGLGTGALAAYAGSGQTFTVYELDPDNLPIAQQEFSYLSLAQSRGADLRFVFGDGRVALRAEPDRSLDLLIIDAFNSGSIPVHLLTVEAFRTYTRVLTARGILLLHVSNKVLDLEPVVYSNARALGLSACEKSNEAGRPPDAEYTYWMAVSSDPERVGLLVNRLGWRRRESGADDLPAPWTDQYSNILGAMF